MSNDVKLTSGKGTMEQRIANRLRPSNDHSTAAHAAVHGSGPTRTVTTVHHGGNVKAHGGVGPLGDGRGEDQ